MQQLIYFIRKYKHFLFFLLLQLIALALIINNHSFHRSKFISSTNIISGTLYSKTSKINDYFNLKSQNKILLEENNKLKNELQRFSNYSDSIKSEIVAHNLEHKQKYSYVNGKVIKNEYHKPYNFITINKGEKHGITPEMAVVNSEGIIGITDDTSNGYTRVQSILNKNSKINARFKNNYYFGTLIWDAKNYNIVQLTDIARQAIFKVGDTVVTGGKSTIFPNGIPIGTVLNLPEKRTASNTINIQLFNDMSNLGYVYVVKSFNREEIKTLEKK